MKETKDFHLKKGRLQLTFLDADKKMVREFTTHMKNVVVLTEQVFAPDGTEVSSPQIVIAGEDENDGLKLILEFKSWWMSDPPVNVKQED